MADGYEFRIAGRLSQALLEAFTALHSHMDGPETVFTVPVRDDAELYGVIARCESLGLKILGMNRTMTG